MIAAKQHRFPSAVKALEYVRIIANRSCGDYSRGEFLFGFSSDAVYPANKMRFGRVAPETA